MKKINRISITVLMICLMIFTVIPSVLIIPMAIQTTNTSDIEDSQEYDPKTSQFVTRTIRVAVYDEPNVDPASVSYEAGSMKNNLTDTLAVLNSAGYQVTQLTTGDIYNHKLKTANYDAFIMVDNCPKDNITNFVKEYWLGGGGLLSFDTAISFLCYAGILPPESTGDNGWQTYWNYRSGDYEVSQRHPVTKAYSVGDNFFTSSTRGSYNWTALLATSVASDIINLTERTADPNDITTLGYDPSTGGGRVVQMPFTSGLIPSNMTDLVNDAVDWVCPRPKGRILFDMSHFNAFGVDSWDYPDYVGWATTYSLMRDNLVNRSYTFDKLYPSALGNLTANNLAPYDMLIINLPDINFTASEVTSVINWINNGGGLLALGDVFTYDGSINLNYLLSSTGLSIIDDTPSNDLTTSFEHPTEEGCTTLTMLGGEEVNYTGNAFPLWGNSLTDICIAGEEYGNGRIILTGDMLLSDDRIVLNHNLQFSINVANWLTATNAKVLIAIADHGINPDPNDNVYRGPVATALNDLRIKFYLTFSCSYLNLSLASNDWDLVIVDEVFNIGHIENYASELIDYMESGGYLIIYSYREQNTSPLWDYLGFTPEGTELNYPPVVYIWDAGHPIFNTPAQYGANNITTSLTPFGTDFINVTLYNNATGIAGLTKTANIYNNTIILGVNGHAITNTFGLTEYYDDTDDSTYPDALEIWENEIAYMTYQSLSVHINTPHTDDVFDATAPSFSITTDGIIIDEMYYTLNDGTHYPSTCTSCTINQGAWDALADGTISLKFYVEDTTDSFKYDAVNIDKDTQAPIIEIISPNSSQTFSTTPPDFIVNITDDHLDKMWYTIDAGLTNFTFTANGTINQAAWDTLSEGTITIGFYANDTLGHESFEQVSVTLDIPSKKKIPGYSTFLIIGVISVISILILEKQLKRLKFKN